MSETMAVVDGWNVWIVLTTIFAGLYLLEVIDRLMAGYWRDRDR